MELNTQESKSPIYSLISMLDEPDPQTYQKISDSIVNFGSAAIPVLEKVSENSFDAQILERLDELIHRIHTDGILHDLHRWKVTETHDILQFLQILSKYHFRTLDMVALNDQITDMQKKIWLELNENLTSLECIRLVNHFTFKSWNLVPDSSNMLEPGNFFLSSVLDSKKTHPALLGAFYLGVCQRLTLPVFYVGLPENFILAYTSQPVFKPVFKSGPILFYINPLLEGVIFNKTEIDRFLKSQEITPKPEYYEAVENIRVAVMMLREMQKIFTGTGDHDRVSDVQRMIGIIEGKETNE